MPREFKTIRELIYWEYAKLVSEKAVGERANFKFTNHIFQKMLAGQAKPASILSENQKMFICGEICAYCGATDKLQWEHLIPVALGGPNTFDNMVRACAACNQSKGPRDPYQWLLNKKPIPRLVLGKFLKVVFEEYERHQLLDSIEFMQNYRIERVSLSSIFQQRIAN
jgi:hypothetical protein